MSEKIYTCWNCIRRIKGDNMMTCPVCLERAKENNYKKGYNKALAEVEKIGWVWDVQRKTKAIVIDEKEWKEIKRGEGK